MTKSDRNRKKDKDIGMQNEGSALPRNLECYKCNNNISAAES